MGIAKKSPEELRAEIRKLRREIRELKNAKAVNGQAQPSKDGFANLSEDSDTNNLGLLDLFNLNMLQEIQDAFSTATGVASLITAPDGTPITSPSNFCRLCNDIIRKTEKGLHNCYNSDSVLGTHNPNGINIQNCLSGGLIDGGASICVGDKHIANWLVGQVRNETIDEKKILDYAKEIGADENEFKTALSEVTEMSAEQFEHICKAMFLIANLMSEIAYKNIQQSKLIYQLKLADKERQDHQKHLENMNAELKRLDKLKDEFLANTSHELRTPLNGIIGLAESLIDGATGNLNEETTENLSMIAGCAKRLSSLVNDILDFSKLKNSDISLQIKSVDIYSVVDSTLAIYHPSVKNKKVKLINNVEKNLPLVEADEKRLQQILHNLIGNAVKFTDKGFVEIFAQSDNNHITIKVKDTGIGIDKKYFDKIFQSFEQVDGTIERQFGGTGLGLSITKQLVELHGGKIYVESDIGKGTCFSFSLRKADPTAQMNKVIDIKNETRVLSTLREYIGIENDYVTHSFENKSVEPTDYQSILVVDDEPVNLQVLSNHLKLRNWKVYTANNGFDALKLIKKHKKDNHSLDLVLLDVMMPRISGYEVCRIIRKDYNMNRLPVIMLTAKNNVEDMIAGFNAGANDYISKPFLKEELFARIDKQIAIKKLHHDLESKNRDLEQLTYTVSHDLKSPLVTIKGFVGIINKEMTNGKINNLANYLGFIDNATDKMYGLLEELLDFLKIGQRSVDYQKISLADIADEALKLICGKIINTNVIIKISPHMPVVYVDKQRMIEVFQNLMDNAIKFMGPQLNPLIEIGHYMEQEKIIVYVKDNGIGIDQKYAEKIFGLFEQLDHKADGSGIGLALVWKIIDMHGGNTWVESKGPGKGSTFFFSLPQELKNKFNRENC